MINLLAYFIGFLYLAAAYAYANKKQWDTKQKHPGCKKCVGQLEIGIHMQPNHWYQLRPESTYVAIDQKSSELI